MWDGVDRRKFVRAEYPCLIKVCKNAPPTKAILTHTEDISVGGIRAIIAKKIEVMSEVDLEIDLMDTLPTIISKGIIKRIDPIPQAAGKPGRYDIGIKFAALHDDDRRRIERITEHLLYKTKHGGQMKP